MIEGCELRFRRLGIDNLSGLEIEPAPAIILLSPRAITFPAQTKIQRQARRHLPIKLIRPGAPRRRTAG